MNEHVSAEPQKRDSSPSLGQQYNPLESSQLENPYPFYARARREEPVFFSERLQAWVITRYEDIRSVLLQPHIFSSKDALRPVVTWIPEVFQILAQCDSLSIPFIINTDGKEHMRFRTPLNQAFLPARLKSMEETVHTVAQRLVDTFHKQGHTELMTSFAGPLPQEIILRMFGIPQADIAQCKLWSDAYVSLIYAPLPPERQIECAHSIVAFHAYMADLIEKQRTHPGKNVVGALLTVHANPTRPLNKQEMVATLSGVLMAGHETTTSLIGTAAYVLLSEPERWQHLCEHPEDIPYAIEEALRFDSAVPTFYRTALQEVQVGRATIAQGDVLLLVYGSANRDEAQFPNPDEFNLHRSSNRHLAFGHGVHFCVGAPLARIEGRIALEVLSQRLSALRLKSPQDISYIPNLRFRGLKQLEVEWDTAQWQA